MFGWLFGKREASDASEMTEEPVIEVLPVVEEPVTVAEAPPSPMEAKPVVPKVEVEVVCTKTTYRCEVSYLEGTDAETGELAVCSEEAFAYDKHRFLHGREVATSRYGRGDHASSYGKAELHDAVRRAIGDSSSFVYVGPFDSVKVVPKKQLLSYKIVEEVSCKYHYVEKHSIDKLYWVDTQEPVFEGET